MTAAGLEGRASSRPFSPWRPLALGADKAAPSTTAGSWAARRRATPIFSQTLRFRTARFRLGQQEELFLQRGAMNLAAVGARHVRHDGQLRGQFLSGQSGAAEERSELIEGQGGTGPERDGGTRALARVGGRQ